MKKYIVICVSLCLCLCLVLAGCTPGGDPNNTVTPSGSGDATPSPSPAQTEDTPLAPTDPIMQVGDYILDGVDLNYYYFSFANDTTWEQYGVDLSKPLDEQFTPDESQTQTWDAFFREYGMQYLEYITPLYLEAKELGMTLSAENQAQRDDELSWIEELCEEGQTVDEYLATVFTGDMTQERLAHILERQLLGMQLEAEKTSQEFSEEEMRAYYEATVPEEEWDTGYSVNVRHILLTATEEGLSEEEAAQAAKDAAQAVYDEWLAGDKTEDSFAELATQHTVDTYSAPAGGLYPDVMQGEMVEAFNDWCFDEARKTGDTGLVDTNYGTHVMYFVEQGTPPWLIAAREIKMAEIRNELITSLQKKYPVTRLV